MEKLRVAKVDSALLQRGKDCRRGTLHLTQHHLIFVFDGIPTSNGQQVTQSTSDSALDPSNEIWFPYSLLWLVTRLPSILPLDLAGTVSRSSAKRIYPLMIRLRNFESAAFGFPSEALLTDVFESVKSCIIAPMPETLYAFYYTPRSPLPLSPQGWHIYDAKAEFARQGVGSRTKGWRYCDVNAGYGFCSTYPSHLCVPARIPDSTIRHASKYRSKERIPALTYLHWANLATITRSSQPLVGLNNRSMQDEKLIEAIFTSHLFADPEGSTAQAALAAGRNNTSTGNAAADRGNVIAIYGATTTNLIIDARPTTNAMANRAKGAGTENMEHYKGCKKVYLGVDNIHVMRDSLQKVTEVLRASEAPSTFGMTKAAAEEEAEDWEGKKLSIISEREVPPLDHFMLKRSSWLKHISALLEGTAIIARNIHVNSSHVLIHCSDGWDRTSQLAALAELCLDPYYRTLKGFAILVEKDWCSFGHRFWDRCGHASSEKYFQTAQGYGEENSEDESGEESGAGVGFEPQSAANAFWGFTKQITANFQSSGDGHSSHGKGGAHLKEISPVFHQFLDCIWQLMRQFPARFEFNERWLLDLFDGVYECKFGTFLYNSEGERNGLSEVGMKAPASTRTISIWDFMLDESRRTAYLNPAYDKSLDNDSKRSGADMGVLLPNSKDVGFWAGVFRADEKEMNQLVQAEAEERKRQLEALERQRQEDLYNASRVEASSVGPSVGSSELNGATFSPMSQSIREDANLRNGVVDLGKADREGLAYQPYQPRNRQGQTTKTVNRTEGSNLAHSSMPSNVTRAAAITTSKELPVEESSLSAQEAAAKMKNLFLGWGAKFQDVYTNATVASEGQSSNYNNNNDHQRPLASRSNSALSRDERVSIPRKAERESSPSPLAIDQNTASRSLNLSKSEFSSPPPPSSQEVDSNPWAASVLKNDLSSFGGLPNELVSGSKEVSPSILKQSEKEAVTAKREEEEKSNTNYDPLGVGSL